jgi:hypothetical protein
MSSVPLRIARRARLLAGLVGTLALSAGFLLAAKGKTRDSGHGDILSGPFEPNRGSTHIAAIRDTDDIVAAPGLRDDHAMRAPNVWHAKRVLSRLWSRKPWVQVMFAGVLLRIAGALAQAAPRGNRPYKLPPNLLEYFKGRKGCQRALLRGLPIMTPRIGAPGSLAAWGAPARGARISWEPKHRPGQPIRQPARRSAFLLTPS